MSDIKDDAAKAYEKRQHERKIEEFVSNMKTSGSTIGSSVYSTSSMDTWQVAMPSPSTRRRAIGDRVRIVDAPGFWVHVAVDNAGIPRSPMLFEVNQQVTEWRMIDETESRLIERLPKTGAFIYIW
mgnify:CR=1 FL=1